MCIMKTTVIYFGNGGATSRYCAAPVTKRHTKGNDMNDKRKQLVNAVMCFVVLVIIVLAVFTIIAPAVEASLK